MANPKGDQNMEQERDVEEADMGGAASEDIETEEEVDEETAEDDYTPEAGEREGTNI